MLWAVTLDAIVLNLNQFVEFICASLEIHQKQKLNLDNANDRSE